MAGNEGTIELTFRVDDQGTVVIDQFNQKIKEVGTQSQSMGGKISGSVKGFTDLYFAGTTAIGALREVYDVTKEFIEAAAEAEQIEKRMAFQIEQVGYSFQSIQPFIDQFANSILQTTRFSDEMAREGLGRMMQYTSSVEEGMNGVRLAMDIATQTGKDYSEVVVLVGMAMSGNVERLGRWVPELKHLDDVLGKDATSAEKAAYAMKVLNEKFGGAAQKDLETYAGKVANLNNQWNELKESAGRALMPLATGLLTTIKWHIDFWTGQGPFKSVQTMIAEEKAAYEAWRIAQAQQKAIRGAEAREETYITMGKQSEAQYKLEMEYAKKRAQLRGKEYALLEMEKNEELEKVRKAKGDEYYVWQFYEEKKIELDKKVIEQLGSLWLEYWTDFYGKQKEAEDKAIEISQRYGVESTAGLAREFKKLEEDWKAALQGPFTATELDEIQKAILGRAEELKTYYGGAGEDRNRLNQVEEAFKRTAESISTMRKEADILAGTGYRVQFDDAAVVQTLNELDAMNEWLKYICEQKKWEIKIKIIPEGFTDFNEAIQKLQGTGGNEGGTSGLSPQDIDKTLADLAAKNRSKFKKALKGFS